MNNIYKSNQEGRSSLVRMVVEVQMIFGVRYSSGVILASGQNDTRAVLDTRHNWNFDGCSQSKSPHHHKASDATLGGVTLAIWTIL